jgi:hypothetical protein
MERQADVTNEIREYAEQEFDKQAVEAEHVHWAPWSSAGVNTSMNYDLLPPRPLDNPSHKPADLPEPAKSGAR